jgi:hypothetical protein
MLVVILSMMGIPLKGSTMDNFVVTSWYIKVIVLCVLSPVILYISYKYRKNQNGN